MSRAIFSVGAAVCASLLISGIVLAQQAQAPESRLRGPQVVPLTAETIIEAGALLMCWAIEPQPSPTMNSEPCVNIDWD